MAPTNTESNTKGRKDADEASKKAEPAKKSEIDTEVVLKRNLFTEEGKMAKGTKMTVSFNLARMWVKAGIAEFT